MRIIKCGNNEIKKQCRNCGCTFAFDESEVMTDTTGRFYGTNGPLRFVVCPQCHREVKVELVIKNKMEYRVGDKVRIKSLDWYNENKDEDGYIYDGSYTFFPCMSKFCGKTFEIAKVHSNCYNVKELCAKTLDWTDEMIEGLVSRIGEGTRSFAEGQESRTKSSSELYEEYMEKINS